MTPDVELFEGLAVSDVITNSPLQPGSAVNVNLLNVGVERSIRLEVRSRMLADLQTVTKVT